MDAERPRERFLESLRMPLPVAIVLAVPGLAMFLAVMGVATYAGAAELWPLLDWRWLTVIAVVAPPVLLAVIIGACTLCDLHGRNPTFQKLHNAWNVFNKLVYLVLAVVFLYFLFRQLS